MNHSEKKAIKKATAKKRRKKLKVAIVLTILAPNTFSHCSTDRSISDICTCAIAKAVNTGKHIEKSSVDINKHVESSMLLHPLKSAKKYAAQNPLNAE
ncbi:hypothetical protein FCV44_14830 [Vibrio kanaloae]|uniref:hypothetical protein n=1 Tax=Vibrio kanaloae TaxID=170673 RepID=UPI0010BEACB1|nr:hypothetical protein [Vibrio kanaloae]TKE94861.1 hypothetical protein FCV44_14830 [Vibrio kanaloae]TKF12789.1 hypothetical protein FCV47_20160 [Vibrio kanaloae]